MKEVEFNKVYKTKMGDGSSFIPQSWFSEKSKILYGFYEGKEHIGLCPLPIERLYIEDNIKQPTVWEELFNLLAIELNTELINKLNNKYKLIKK